jgi:hypothetical protein
VAASGGFRTTQGAGFDQTNEDPSDSEHSTLGEIEISHVSLLSERPDRAETFPFHDCVAFGYVPDAKRVGIEVLEVRSGASELELAHIEDASRHRSHNA